MSFYGASHGRTRRRSRPSTDSNECRGRAAVPDTCPSQARGFCARRRGGHHRSQLWTRERSASLKARRADAPKRLISNNDRCASCVAECARVFHAAGALLVLCGRDAGRLQQVVQELTAASSDTKRQVLFYPTFNL